ncbi:MAG: thioredoxin [bacterium]|nr:thioredoxin [bacterium]
MASEKVIQLTDAEFENTVVNSSIPVLVDFWAEWCGPCRRVGPIVDELAGEYEGKIKVAKINIDEHQSAANQLGVQSIPTLMLFKGGKLAERIVGAVPKETLVEAISRVL